MRRLVVGVVALLASACWHIEGSGVYKEESRPVGTFSQVSVSSALEAEIAVGAEPSVLVTGDDNLVALVQATVDGERLTLSTEPGVSYLPDQPLVVRVTVPSVTELEASGASKVIARGLSGRNLGIEVSGASTVDAAGWSDRLDVEVSGASKLNAFDLGTQVAFVEVSGASKAKVRADCEATIEASGASHVEVVGNARIREDVSGASSVERIR